MLASDLLMCIQQQKQRLCTAETDWRELRKSIQLLLLYGDRQSTVEAHSNVHSQLKEKIIKKKKKKKNWEKRRRNA